MESKQNKKIVKPLTKPSLATIKKGKTNKSSLVEKFNSLGKHKWINLENMEKNKPHLFTNLRKTSTKYGERIMVQLDGELQLYLPERYNTFTDRQLMELGNGNYHLINHGLNGKIYRLEIVKTEDIPTATDQSPASPEAHTSFDGNMDENDDDDDDNVPKLNYYGYAQESQW